MGQPYECLSHVLQIVEYGATSLFCPPLSLVNGIAMSYTAHMPWQKEMTCVFASREYQLSATNHSLPVVRKT